MKYLKLTLFLSVLSLWGISIAGPIEAPEKAPRFNPTKTYDIDDPYYISKGVHYERNIASESKPEDRSPSSLNPMGQESLDAESPRPWTKKKPANDP